MDDYTRDELDTILKRLTAAQDRTTRANIDAACCQTPSDWRRAREAEEAYYKAHDEAIEEIGQLFKNRLPAR